MPKYDAFPDSEAISGWSLRQASIAGGRVYSSVPHTPTFPLVILQRIGGVPVERHRIDGPRLQFTVWGNSKSEAHDIAQQARVVLHGMEGTNFTVAGGAPVNIFVAGVEDDLGMFWSPDPPTGRDRYIFGVRLYTHA